MRKCEMCYDIGRWKCLHCEILLCAYHKPSHIDDESEHNIVKAKISVAADVKSNVINTITFKIQIIDECILYIIRATDIVITHISNSYQIELMNIYSYRMQNVESLLTSDQENLEEKINQIIKYTGEIIGETNRLSRIALIEMDNIKNQSLQLLKSLNQENFEEIWNELELKAENVIIYEKLGSIDQFYSWIQQEIIRETPKSSYFWVEYYMK